MSDDRLTAHSASKAPTQSGTVVAQIAAQKERAEIAERVKHLMAEQRITYHAATQRLGVSAHRAVRIKREFNIVSDQAIRSEAISSAQKARHAKERERDAALLADLERMRPERIGILTAATRLKISEKRASDIWRGAHPGVSYSLNGPGRYKLEDPAKPAFGTAASTGLFRVISATLAARHPAHMTSEDRAARDAGIAHAQRTAVLPPVTADEAARLVADFLARKSVTVCEPAFAAHVNNNSGL